MPALSSAPFRPTAKRTEDVDTVTCHSAQRDIAPSRYPAGMRLIFVAAVIAALVAMAFECIVRLGLWAGIDRLRDPGLYAADLQGDDYWRLHYRWRATTPIPDRAGFEHDPELGWIADRTFRRHPNKTPILIFGDSFAQGVPPTGFRERLPRALDLMLPEHQVIDFAVSGYGVDQIFLRLRREHRAFERPRILFCIMTQDVDRVVQKVRGAPKPYFEIEGGSLALRGVPVPKAVSAWHAANPPTIRSYAWALVSRRWHLARSTDGAERDQRRDQKAQLTRLILEATVREAEQHDLQLSVVLLYPSWDLTATGWREVFLKQTLASLGASVIDTKPIMWAAAAVHPDGLDGLYFPAPNHHPNVEGNRVLASHLATVIKGREAS